MSWISKKSITERHYTSISCVIMYIISNSSIVVLLPEIKLGDSCEFDSDCDATVRYAVCSDDDVCVCEGREQVGLTSAAPVPVQVLNYT